MSRVRSSKSPAKNKGDIDIFMVRLQLAFIGVGAKRLQECLQEGFIPGIMIWNDYISKKLRELISL